MISSIITAIAIYFKTRNIFISILSLILLYIPISEIVLQLSNYILSKAVKPKLIPKIDFSKGIPEEYSTFVVIPTILNSCEKVKKLIRKLEVYYLANKSENLYFALLGDCISSKNETEKIDNEIINTGLEEIKKINEKHSNLGEFPKFHFLYRKRTWNASEECYLGWERKRGLLCQFNEFLVDGNNNFWINTINDYYTNASKEIVNASLVSIHHKIKYVITLDSDTNPILNSCLELVGAMAHILNKPILNKNEDLVIEGHSVIQPRVGINLEASRKSLFTKLYAGARRNGFIHKCNIRYISR